MYLLVNHKPVKNLRSTNEFYSPPRIYFVDFKFLTGFLL